MGRRGAFTLMEVLISVVLISLILLGLYGSLDLQRDSNRRLHRKLQETLAHQKVLMAFYRDLLFSDGNLTIHKGDFDRLCIERTGHSLYGLPDARVCWVVSREDKELLRVEGGEFRLPLRDEDRVAVDSVLGPMELFDLTRRGGRLLVAMREKGSEGVAFLVRGLDIPKKKKKRKRKMRAKKKTRENMTVPKGHDTGKKTKEERK